MDVSNFKNMPLKILFYLKIKRYLTHLRLHRCELDVEISIQLLILYVKFYGLGLKFLSNFTYSCMHYDKISHQKSHTLRLFSENELY